MFANRFARFLILCLCVYSGLAMIFPEKGAAQGTIVPLVKCVRYHVEPAQDNVLEVFFGYISTHTADVQLPEDNNFFFPGPRNRGQPTVFPPGLNDQVFVTTFQVSPSTPQLTWFLGEFLVTARLDTSRYCDPPRERGPWESTIPYVNNDVVGFNGSLWQQACQRTVLRPSLNEQPGSHFCWVAWQGLPLSLKTDGQPGPAGPQGPQGPQGAQGLQGIQGPPGASGVANIQRVSTTHTLTNPGTYPLSAACPSTGKVTAGGMEVVGVVGSPPVALQSYPATSTAWSVHVSFSGKQATVRIWAVCVG